MTRAQQYSVLPIEVLSLLILLSNYGCGRTDLLDDDAGTAAASIAGTGGAGISGSTSTGGRPAAGGVPSTGGRSFSGGVPSTGGRSFSGGVPSTGGRSISGGVPSTGGRSISGGAPSTGGRTATGGTSSTGGRPTTGGSTNAGGRATGGNNSGVTGGTFTTGGLGSGGQTGTTPSFGGAAGSSSISQWYVDAQNGSDDSPGTSALPFRTLNRAASAALAGDTVNLFDGVWDSSIDAKLAGAATTACGLSSGVAFAPNITLRAVNSGNARIIGAGYHGVCMSGGLIDGLRLDCNAAGRPILETQTGVLEIVGSSLRNCGYFGIDVAGTAEVTVQPGNLTDYSDVPNAYFAIAREQSSLTIEGGTLSFVGLAIQAQDTAKLVIHGVTFASQDSANMAGIAVTLVQGSPELVLDGGTSMDNIAIGVEGYGVTSNVVIDDLKFTRGNLAVMVNETTGASVPNVTINKLVFSDINGPGIDVGGPCNVSVTNISSVRCDAPAIIVNGTGSLTIDTVTVSDGWGGLIVSGDGTGGALAAIVRNVSVTGGQYSGAVVTAYSNDSIDFGTALSPGNNVFRRNNLIGDAAAADLVFTAAAGTIVYASGNTWDANQQGSDASGWYHVSTAGVPLDVFSGAGPNYLSGTLSAGILRLAQ